MIWITSNVEVKDNHKIQKGLQTDEEAREGLEFTRLTSSNNSRDMKKASTVTGRCFFDVLIHEAKGRNFKVLSAMMAILNIIDPSVPPGKDDSENVELERVGA